MLKNILKKILSAVLCTALFVGGVFVTNGYGERELRVGLERYYTGVSSINVNNSQLTLSYSGTGVTLNSTSGFVLQPVSGSYIVEKSFSSLDNALENGDAVYDENGWGVYKTTTAKAAVEETTQEVITEELVLDEITEETTENITREETKKTKSEDTNSFNSTAIKVTYSEGSFVINSGNNVVLSTNEEAIDLGEMAYRNKVEVVSTGSSLNAVNILTMDEYLYGVVPAEVYSSWPAEALKAQAVTARSYAQYHFGKHSGYDLCDHTHCQQYSGYNIEAASTNAAVDATSGVMAYYNGKVINAVCFDCSGGHTLSAEEVWGSDIPYLQSIPDPYEIDARQWERTFTYDELTSLAAANGFDVGEVTNVQITKIRDNIVVEDVTITGTKGSAIVSGKNIKTFFKQDGENLWSRNFTISGSSAPSNNIYVTGVSGTAENINVDVVSAIDSNGQVTVLQDINCVLRGKDGDVVISNNGGQVTEAKDSIVISGAGWGHGVGFSQRGSHGLAEKGYDYEEILKFYYKGIEVK